MLSQTATNPDEPRPLYSKATRLKLAEDAERMDSELIQNIMNIRSRTLPPGGLAVNQGAQRNPILPPEGTESR